MSVAPLNLFYAEPDPDRWLPGDRYPRRLIRRLARGPRQPGGQLRVFLNLCAGLDALGVPYRTNPFRHCRRHPDALACIIGKPFLLDHHAWENPILFGASVFSHPLDDPDLLARRPVCRILVPGEWTRRMFAGHYGDLVHAWPVGIDTDLWRPAPAEAKDIDVLLYDKIRWNHDALAPTLVGQAADLLSRRGLRTAHLRYGHYREGDFHSLLDRSRAMIFFCEHETQGIAYQQALSCGVPLLAWDRGGEWQDPSYHPGRVRFGPVSSVPYWDDGCGMRFAGPAELPEQLEKFLAALAAGAFAPRDYVLEHLTLAQGARQYLAHLQAITGSASPFALPPRAVT